MHKEFIAIPNLEDEPFAGFYDRAKVPFDSGGISIYVAILTL